MKDKLPLLSISIPFYNEEKYLDECLKSIFNQSYKNFEIIVIDDGSCDRSLNIVKKYKVKILQQNHQGPGTARNLGGKKAKGEILAFLDADMKFDKDYLKYLIEPIVENKAVGTFNKEEFVANPQNIWSQCWSINSNLPKDRRLPTDYRDQENAFRAILKEVFIKGNGFEPKEGYQDDSSLSRKIKMTAINASGAISYHFNPSTLAEVYYSARWIGRSPNFKRSIINFLRYSIINSLRISIKYFFSGAPMQIFIFKIVYDFGMLNGIFLKKGNVFK